MTRKSQVDKLTTAARETRIARQRGSSSAAARARATYAGAYRNASDDERRQADRDIWDEIGRQG
ncbi:hypothetical protein DP939_23335 [Spongiactinospora rosea]|uniref:Uncharacterized protein n=1 Tax=Spongiactinospora rosea TaxID=2248750 RepID=A0A366LV16_9ACTN|nr:hypothetical protein [Spongiactinospora rosea]RBQ17795.1 hypothetical protein DP939_23335 [Spongiactinospora rosea]